MRSSPIFPLRISTEKLRIEGVLELLLNEPEIEFLTREGLEIPLEGEVPLAGDEAEDVQSLLGDAGRMAPLIGEDIVRGEDNGPSLTNFFD
jgi:hypothetical protein